MNDLLIQDEISPYDVAIIGMEGKFPGAANIEEFERNLVNGICSITFFSDEELISAGVSEEDFNQPNYIRARGWLDGIEFFDAKYFGYSPLEAKLMDPQHRLFLEGCVAALENAGYDSERYDGAISVFAGVSSSPYVFRLFANEELADSVGTLQALMGFDKDFVPTRASYKLNLKGASFNLQTACSTSLVAVHLGCQTLLNGQSDIVLAGGVSIGVPEKQGYIYTPGGVSSPDGLCRAFDADGKGVPGGNGIGIVVLKRLNDAIKDRDSIYAVIKGSAINNDGNSKIGFTAPSVEGQAACISEAIAVSEIDPETITYVEAHGTATELGDPIEIAALTQAFQTDKRNFCAVGSVKTNVGHLDVAAGVAGLIKTAISIKKGFLPPSLNFSTPNPSIDFENSPFYVNRELQQWKTADGIKRRAGVSSFGLGGTNAHLIVEEPPIIQRNEAQKKPHLLILSALDESALERSVTNLGDFFEKNTEARLGDAAFTLQTGRKLMPERKAFVCADSFDASKVLRGEKGISVAGRASEKPPSIIFMFPGGGAQYLNMARDLYESEAVFRTEFDKCVELAQKELDRPLLELMYPKRQITEKDAENLRKPSIGLPLLFAVEYALTRLWLSIGIEPKAFIGHSLGEYTAACFAGVLALEDAVKLVVLRGKLFEKLPAGMMLNVPLSEAEIVKILPSDLDIAALNAPDQTLVSGSFEAIQAFNVILSEKGIEGKKIRVDTASHSRFVEPILEEFENFIKEIILNPPQIPYISNVTGNWIKDSEAVSPDFWTRHLRETVKFSAGLEKLCEIENDLILLEIGGGTLGSLAKSCIKTSTDDESRKFIVHSLKHPLEEADDREIWLSAVGKLWTLGDEIDWDKFHLGENPYRIALPTYPFERERFWLEESFANKGKRTSRKKEKPENWFYTPSWKRETLQAGPEKESKNWLIFGGDEKLKDFLSKRFENIVWIKKSVEFKVTDNENYEINPQKQTDYSQILSELKNRQKLPDRLLFFADFGVFSEKQADLAADIFCAPLYFLQALNETASEQKVEIALVTSDFFEVTGNEKLSSPSFAAVAGIARTASQEFENISAFWTDLETNNEDKIYENLINEFGCAENGRTIAFRGKYRWRLDYQNVSLPEPAKFNDRFKEKGTYLITGGLGGLALEISEELTSKYNANLILVGRRKLPQKSEWKTISENETSNFLLKKTLAKLLEIESKGGNLLTISADCGDRDQLLNAIETAQKQFGKIDGVIHTAGIFPGGMMQIKDRNSAEDVFSAKVHGTLALSDLLGDDLDFVVYFSSLNALSGGFGQSDYCAANAFLDNFALRRNLQNADRKQTYFSINWDTWQETGGAFNASLPSDLSQYREINLRNKILNNEGKEAFFRIMNSNISQTAVSVRNLETILAEELAAKPQAAIEFVEPDSARKQQNRPKLVTSYKAPQSVLENNIAELWQNLLGIEPVGVNDNFFELGGHSLLATQLTAWVKRKFDLDLPLRKIFEFPTIAKWAKEVERVLGEKNTEFSQTPPNQNLIVPFRQNKFGKLLFLVHAMSGTSSVYQSLAENLQIKSSIYGIDAVGLNGIEKPLETIEEMAEIYANAIEYFKNDKEIILCGWSFGGLIAFEMARKLKKSAKNVELILIDTPTVADAVENELSETETLIYMAKMFSEEIEIEINEMKNLDYSEQLAFVLQKLKAEKLIPERTEPESLRGFVKVFRANCKAISDYRPSFEDISVNLIRILDKNITGTLAISNETLGWERFAGGKLNISKIEGNHYTIVKEPFVKRLSEAVETILFSEDAKKAAS